MEFNTVFVILNRRYSHTVDSQVILTGAAVKSSAAEVTGVMICF